MTAEDRIATDVAKHLAENRDWLARLTADRDAFTNPEMMETVIRETERQIAADMKLLADHGYGEDGKRIR